MSLLTNSLRHASGESAPLSQFSVSENENTEEFNKVAERCLPNFQNSLIEQKRNLKAVVEVPRIPLEAKEKFDELLQNKFFFLHFKNALKGFQSYLEQKKETIGPGTQKINETLNIDLNRSIFDLEFLQADVGFSYMPFLGEEVGDVADVPPDLQKHFTCLYDYIKEAEDSVSKEIRIEETMTVLAQELISLVQNKSKTLHAATLERQKEMSEIEKQRKIEEKESSKQACERRVEELFLFECYGMAYSLKNLDLTSIEKSWVRKNHIEQEAKRSVPSIRELLADLLSELDILEFYETEKDINEFFIRNEKKSAQIKDFLTVIKQNLHDFEMGNLFQPHKE